MSEETNIPEKSASPHHHNDELTEIKQILEKYGKQALTILLVVMIAFSAYQFYSMRKQNHIAEASAKLNAARSIPDLETIVSEKPGSAISEAYKAIRTALLLSSPDASPEIILVSSMNQGAGKTVTSLNLAIALAQSEKKVRLHCLHVLE